MSGVGLLAVAAACADSLGSDPSAVLSAAPAPPLSAAVTSLAAAALDSAGRFRLVDPIPRPGVEIRRPEAVALAHAFVRTQGPSLKGLLTKERGAPVATERLAPCERAVYASSPFEDAPPGTPGFVRRAFGAWWIVPLCEPGAPPSVLIAVSAMNTSNVQVTRDGLLRYSLDETAGADFAWRGIPMGQTDPIVVGPERAARLAAGATRRQVARVPELVAPNWREGSPFDARWRLRLDRAARVRTLASRESSVEEVFVGEPQQQTAISTAAPTQPAEVSTSWMEMGPLQDAGRPDVGPTFGQQRSVTVRRLASTPLRYENVAPVQEETP